MARPITLLAIFFLSMSLFSTLIMSTGIGASMGLQKPVGGQDAAETATEQAQNVSTGAPTGSTLFGMYNVLAEGLSTLATPITAGPMMLKRAGVPAVITDTFLTPLIMFVYAIGIISFLRGWGL